MSSQIRATRRPLKERILNASIRSPTTSKSTAATQLCSRMKYKQYDESKLYQAYRDVIEGKLSTRRAALENGVPLSTLSDRITGKVQFGKKGGVEKYLKDSEELELENFIVKLAALGFGIYPFNPKALLPEVQKVSPIFNPASLCEKTGINYIPLYSPRRKFCQSDHRHTTPNDRSGDTLPKSSLVYPPESPIHSPKSSIPVVSRSLDDSSVNYGGTTRSCSKTAFTLEEIARYQRCFDEGYDIPDERYQLWLKHNRQTHHMKESTPLEDSNDTIHLSYRSTFSTFLEKKVPEIKVPKRTATKASSRVLTSAQNRKNMEEKRAQKEKEKALREERKVERERRKLEREAAATQKQLKKRCKVNDKEVPNSSPSLSTTSSPVKTKTTRLKSSQGACSSLVNAAKRATNSKVSATTISPTITTTAKSIEDNYSSLPPVTKKPSCNPSQSSSLPSVVTRATKRRSLIPVPTSRGTRPILNQGSRLCHTLTKTRPNISNQVYSRGTSSINDSLGATADSESYCWCGGPEKGRMVACDNKLCKKQWFHYECLGIRRAPKGAWYCSKECREE